MPDCSSEKNSHFTGARNFKRVTLKAVSLMAIGCAFPTTQAYAQQITCDGRAVQAIDFTNGVLSSGANLQPGAIYSYTGVFPGINAEFEILSFVNGASLAAFDNDDGILDRNLQPELVPNSAGGGHVNFRITFFDAITSAPIDVDLAATQIDVDGDNATLREFVEFQDRFVEFTINNPSRLNVNASGPSQPGRQRFEARTSTVAPGIDITAVQNIVRAIYTNASSFEFALGTLGAGTTTRLTSLSFDCPSITNPSTTASSADLVTVKTLGSDDSAPVGGDTVTFNIAVTNNGPNGSSGVTLTDLIPTGLTPSENNGNVSAGSYNPSNGFWSIGALDVGATATLTIEGVVNTGQGGETITNLTTAAAADQPDPTVAGDDLEEEVAITPLVDLAITKTNTPGVNGEVDQADDTLTSGSTTTYTLIVTNNGPDTVTGAVLTDTPESGLTCPAANPVTLEGSGVPAGVFTVADLTGNGITLETLADGESTTITYSCEVDVI